MRIMVYKEDRGTRRILLIPGRAMHLPPIVLQGQSKEALRSALRDTLQELAVENQGPSQTSF